MLFTKIKTIAMGVIFLTGISFGASLEGKLTDSQTGEPVPGAMVRLADRKTAAVSDTDGKFTLHNLPSEGELVISHIGYNVAKRKLKFKQLESITIELDPKILQGQDVIVTATRAKKGQTPAAFSNMSNQEIQQNYWAQDVPMLLTSMPNVFAYSEAGNGIGYSYMKIRGFDQKRISVMLNGIPLNDAESHEVFWVDLPDFAANVQDIQVQRGVGISLYGPSSIGGAVNLVTSDLPANRQIKVNTGYGSYDTKKASISFNSGLLRDSYVIYGRYSRIETDGYRTNSWTKMHSYFFSAVRYDEYMTWKFNTYGGPEESHLAYKGITQEQLYSDRQYNELEYDGEIDHFNQPHYEFLHDWKISDNLKLENTFYYFHGEGHYTQKRNRKDVEEYLPGIYSIEVSDTALAPKNYYDLDDDGNFQLNDDGFYEIRKVDLIRRRTVKEYDWGWIPRLSISHRQGTFTIGGEIRIHSGHHLGEVRWANVYPEDFPENVRYYDYRGKSNTFTVYANETYKLTDKLLAMVNIQYQRHNYQLLDDKRFQVVFNRDYDFISPRGGLNLKVNEDINIFANVSTTSRQPAFKDIYDPTDYWSNPYYKPGNFSESGTEWDFTGKELKPEKLFDIEIGTDFTSKTDEYVVKGSVNIYRMRVTDELIPYAGQIDDDGYPISGNAEKTIHQGIEIFMDMNLNNGVSFNWNFSLNDDHFVEYTEYGFDWDLWEAIELDRADNRIGGFPEYLANSRFGYRFDKFNLGLNYRIVGSQYIDNGEESKIRSYNLLDADISYDLSRLFGVNSLKATLRINNLSNKQYVQAAYIEVDDGLPRYMVGAEHNLYFSIAAEF